VLKITRTANGKDLVLSEVNPKRYFERLDLQQKELQTMKTGSIWSLVDDISFLFSRSYCYTSAIGIILSSVRLSVTLCTVAHRVGAV